MLLRQSQECQAALERVLVELLHFYSQTGQRDRLAFQAERLVALGSTPERRAECCLGAGGLMEKLGDFEAAASLYRRILPLEPVNPDVWYFCHNNLAYSLNQLGRYAEAESYCRRAIAIDPRRHNAYKNLGLVLGGPREVHRGGSGLSYCCASLSPGRKGAESPSGAAQRSSGTLGARPWAARTSRTVRSE